MLTSTIIILGVIKDIENLGGKELGDELGHARETVHEERDGLLAVERKEEHTPSVVSVQGLK
jgi:hypothetical protein